MDRAAKVAQLREEKWKEETRKAEEAARRRAQEAEEKAKALQAGTLTPGQVHVNPTPVVEQHIEPPKVVHEEVQQQHEEQPIEEQPIEEQHLEEQHLEEQYQNEEQVVEQEIHQEYEEGGEEEQFEVEQEVQQEHEEGAEETPVNPNNDSVSEPDFGFGNLAFPKGDADQAIAEIQNCDAENPCTVYLNALIRKEESMSLVSLNDIRDGVTFYTSSGHKVNRSGKYTIDITVSEDDIRQIGIPPAHMLNDDFNAISDYFFFGTAEYLTLYPDETLNPNDEMQVNDLTTLSPEQKYYLPSGNFVEIIGGENPQFLLNGDKQVALPEEVSEMLRY